MNIKTTLHAYRFNIENTDEQAEYLSTIERIQAAMGDKRVWDVNLTRGYTANPEGWKFHDRIDKAAGRPTNANGVFSVEIELETAHLFDNQWNSAPFGDFETGARLFDWTRYEYLNKRIKAGYWLEQTPEMAEILRNTMKCGYCGKQEPAAKGYVFCPHCLGSEHLKASDLKLTRMRPVRDSGPGRDFPELTKAEREYLMPLYKEAQLHGVTERDKKRLADQRARIAKDYEQAIHVATTERDGFTWILDHGLKIDNVIYYSHTDRFSWGWRAPVDPEVVSAILDVISEFPFQYEIKCADGRTLSN